MPEITVPKEALPELDNAAFVLAMLYKNAVYTGNQALVTKFHEEVPELRGCEVDARSLTQPEIKEILKRLGSNKVVALGNRIGLFIALQAAVLCDGNRSWLREDIRKMANDSTKQH